MSRQQYVPVPGVFFVAAEVYLITGKDSGMPV
jgi:hypothetical protein